MYSPSVIDSPSGRVPKKASRWDLVVQELASTEKLFRVDLCLFPDFREFIEAELGQTEPRGPHEPPGRALVPRGPLLHLLALSRSFQGLL